jgi:hypothetical protein
VWQSTVYHPIAAHRFDSSRNRLPLLVGDQIEALVDVPTPLSGVAPSLIAYDLVAAIARNSVRTIASHLKTSDTEVFVVELFAYEAAYRYEVSRAILQLVAVTAEALVQERRLIGAVASTVVDPKRDWGLLDACFSI